MSSKFCPCGSGKAVKACCGKAALAAEQKLMNGVAFHQSGNLQEADRIYTSLLNEKPVRRHAFHYLGMIRFQQGQYEDAIRFIQEAIGLENNGVFYTNLANALARCERLDEAEESHRKACTLAAGNTQVHLNFGRFLVARNRQPEARAHYLSLPISLVVANQDLAMLRAWAEFQIGHYGVALDLCRSLRRLLGDRNRDILSLEAVARASIGDVEGSLTAYRHMGLETSSQTFQSWLFAKQMRAWPKADCLADHRRWAEVFGSQECHLADFADQLRSTSGRRLRIGYLSPDFRKHAMRFFIRPLFARHDREAFEVHAFFCGGVEDEYSHELAGLAGNWHDVRKLSDEEIVAAIRHQEIDVLIDLAGHSANNRMGVLIMQAAPVQMSMLGYLATLASPQIPYRVADAYSIPAHMADAYSEEILRFEAHSQWCYGPDAESDLPSPDFAPERPVTFGAFHNSSKMSDEVLLAWKEILLALPEARLALVMWDETEQALLEKRLKAIAFPVAQLAYRKPGIGVDYWKLYQEVDVCLDVFPYNGGTVSFDALWMGVPMVSCSVDHPAGGGGKSIASHLGHPEWCAASPAEYAAMAIEMGRHGARDGVARQALREELKRSPLMDELGYTREFEAMIQKAVGAVRQAVP